VINAEPSGDPADLILVSMLGSPMPEIGVDGAPATAELASEGSRSYQFTVSEAGALVTVDLASEASEADFDLGVGLAPGSHNWTSTKPGSNESIRLVAPRAGIYFVEVYSSSGEGEYSLAVAEA